MRTFAQSALTISLAAALLGGCSGSQHLISASGAMPLSNASGSPSYRVLYSFAGIPDGANPIASLVDVKGVLYGTTFHGGRHHPNNRAGPGTVFSITTTGAEHVLHIFGGRGGLGNTPVANLIGVGGILYGTTMFGGQGCLVNGCGTIFSITTTGKWQLVHSFAGSDGAFPAAGLVNIRGTLYGTTSAGGDYRNSSSGYFGLGTVFSVTKGGTEQVLHSFGNGSDGKKPMAPLLDVHGTLYGTTYSGGAYGCASSGGCGTVFSITPGGTETVLHSFGSGNDGKWPRGGLVELNGKLYGTTSGGGDSGCRYAGGCGTVFSITPGGKEKVIYSFGNGPDGVYPYAGLINVGGTLYGTTIDGGSYGSGTVFSVTPTGTEEVLHSFGPSATDGLDSFASLIDENGTIYGTTRYGGTHAYGTVFALTP